MAILVLGGTGFIGPRAIRRLVARGEEIVCMDINPQAAAFNIPLNNVLATFTATDAPGRWPQYVASWLAWNHVRTVCAVVATVLYAAGLIAYERNMK